MFKQKQKAFTLIELLVVIAIIGILATLAVVSLQQARQNARDSKRMADMKQLHTALELFANKYGRYPTTEEWNQGFIGSSTENIIFMQNIPNAPTPADGNCLDSSNTYIYIPQNNGATYTINFCTGKQVSDLPEGAKQMTPGGIIFGSSELGGEETPVWTCGDDFIDTRDGNVYPTVQIGTQCWFVKNMNYDNGCSSVVWVNGSDEGWCGCYNNDNNNCDTYGLLYQWSVVMNGNTTEGSQGICPVGWHIPTDNQQYILESYLSTGTCDSSRTLWDCDPAGAKLKTDTWGGDNSSGFTALPGGYRYSLGYQGLNSNFTFWTSSFNGSGAWHRNLISSLSSVYRTYSFDAAYFVRCLKD